MLHPFLQPYQNDNRPIALLSHIAKLWETSVKIMMDVTFDAEKLIARYQGGFRYLRGIDTTSLTLESLGELCKAQGLPKWGTDLGPNSSPGEESGPFFVTCEELGTPPVRPPQEHALDRAPGA